MSASEPVEHHTVLDWLFLGVFVLRLLASAGQVLWVAFSSAPASEIGIVGYWTINWFLPAISPLYLLYAGLRRGVYDAWPPRLDWWLFLAGWALDVGILAVYNVWFR